MRKFLRNSMLSCLCLLLWIGTASSNPTFQKVPCDFVPDRVKYDLCLYVSFPDQTDDWMLLHKVRGEETVFKGTLYNEGTRVCVVIEDASNPDDIEVVMHSKHSGGKMFFHTDLRGRGPAEIIDIPPHSDVYLIPPNDTFTNRDASLKDRNLPSRALPSNGFRLNVHAFYDDTFNAQFGSDATTRITAIFTIVETIYSDSSLTSVIDPNIIQISYISGASWEATEPILRDVSSNIAVPSTSNGNAYVFLCYQNNQGGVVGIAWVRGTCSSSRFGRSSVNEYLSNDVVTASIVAHEMGHNLGMRHDFGSTTSVPRFSSTGEACTGIGGYMDYQPNPNRWSPCSVEDYTSYFESVNPWCLSPLPNEVSTTTATTITTTTTTTSTITTTTTSTTTTTTTSTTTSVTSTTSTMSTTSNTVTTSTTTSATSETSTEGSGEISSSTTTSASSTDSKTTSTTSINDATTTEEQCTDKYWCQWKPQWTCRYWTIVRKYCPNKCGVCNGDQTTTTTSPTPPTCEDRFSTWCRWNRWRCGFSTSIRRNCPKSCKLC